MEQNKRKKFTDYPIQAVKQEHHGSGTIWIDFKIADCSYEFEINFSSGVYQLKRIYHHDVKDRDCCPFCSNELNTCEILTRKKEEVFKQVTQHPAIRLYWVFNQHLVQFNEKI